jgi:hypothetical protein
MEIIMSKKLKTPLLTITNPWLLWFFQHGGEEIGGDLGWGKTHVGQLALATTIHELASQISDDDARKQTQEVAAKSIVHTGEKLATGR